MRHEKANPILSNAIPLLTEYSLATGTFINILDYNCLPIPELFNANFKERNICYFCATHCKQYDGFKPQASNSPSPCSIPKLAAPIPHGNPQHPSACRKMHINAVKESQRLGGTHTYLCSYGMTLWISPIYLNENFAGALLGGSFASDEHDRIKALAELLLFCSQSVSIGSEGRHKALERHSMQREQLSELIEELKGQYPVGSKKAGYPTDKERKMLEALHTGNIVAARQLLNEVIAFVLHINRDDFRHIKCRAIELAFLLSRVGLNSFFTIKTMLKNDRRNFMAIEKTNNTDELIHVLYRIMDDLEELQFSFNRTHHASAIKKAEDYILENFSKKLCLKAIAKASGFSGPYFSKIFKDAMGENLTSYLNRLRVEKATSLLTNTNLSLCNIAQICGFADQSWFSKTFKYYAGKSPGKFRSQCGKPWRKSLPI